VVADECRTTVEALAEGNSDGDIPPTGGAGGLILEGLNIETCPLLTPVWLFGRARRYVLAG
jgi:hypothetical protein